METKYPRTPYWPYSPSIGRGDAVHSDPGRFVGKEVVATEKLDGGNTMLHRGRVYARSTFAPAEAKWMAMVKKHHAWKVTDPDTYLYGEDIFGVHSIAYDPVPEDETFYAFALRDGHGAFASFATLESYTQEKRIPLVPVLFKGRFASMAEMQEFLDGAHGGSSALGGTREGIVLRLADGFPASEFSECVCKSVREGHVQTEDHWTRNWRPCPLLPARAEPRTPA